MLSIEHSMKKKKRLKVSLLLSSTDSIVQMSIMVPIIASIAETFSDAGKLLDQVISITALTMVLFILLSGKISERVNPKRILMTGTSFLILGGLSGMIAQNIWALLISRIIVGVGAGLALPQVPSISAILFEGRERAEVLGWQNACGAFLGFILGLGAGIIALFQWKAAFLLYLIFVPILIMQHKYIPDIIPQKKQPTVKEEPMGMAAIAIVLCLILYSGIGMMFSLRLSLFIVTDLGGTTAQSGFSTSVMTVGSFIVGVFFAKLFDKYRSNTPVIALFLMSACYFLLAAAPSVYIVYLAMFSAGLGSGIIFPYFFTIMSFVSPKSRQTWAMTLICMAQLLGQFTTSLYCAIVESFTNGIYRSSFFVTAVVFLILGTVVRLIFSMRKDIAERMQIRET